MITATGRTPSDPNLQNVPVRTPEGQRLRQAAVSAFGGSPQCHTADLEQRLSRQFPGLVEGLTGRECRS